MSSTRENCSELSTYQPSAQNADTHIAALSVSFASRRSQARHSLQLFRVASALDFNLRRGAVDLAKISGGQFHGCRSDIFFEAVQLRRSRDRNHPGFLREQPRQRDLRRSRIFAHGNFAEKID